MKKRRSLLAHFRRSARARHTALASSIAALLSLQVVQGASQVWTGNGSDGLWSDIQDWLGIAAPGSTSSTTNPDVATFNAPIANTWGNSAVNPVVIDSTTQNIGGISFDTAAGNYFIGSTAGHTLNVSSGGSIQVLNTLTATNGTYTINAPLQIQGAGGTYTLANNSANGNGVGAGTLKIGGGITGGATGSMVLTLSGKNTNANTISGNITNGSAISLQLTKSGSGIWTLTGTNSYTGTTLVRGGALQVSTGGAISATSGIDVGGTTNSVLAINGGSVTAVGPAGFTVGSAEVVNTTSVGTLYLSSGSLIFSGTGGYPIIGGNQLGTGGTGKGTFYQSGGTFTSTVANSNVLIGYTEGTGTATGIANFSGGTFTGTSGGEFLIGVNQSGTSTTGTVNVDGTAAVSSGVQADVATINLGGGTFTTPAWTATTNTNVNFHGGTLRASAPSSTFLGSMTNAIKLYTGGGKIDTNGNDITITQAFQNPAGSGVSATPLVTDTTTVFTAPPTVTFTGGTSTAAALGYATLDVSGHINGIIITNPGSYTVAPTSVTVAGSTATFTPTLTANSTGGLTKLGTGTLTLSGANTYSGGTTVNAGTLTLSGSGTLGAVTGTLTVNNPNTGAGTAVVLNLSTTAATTTGSLSGTIATPSSGTNTATINNGGQLFTVNQTTPGKYAGVIAGGGGFTLGSLSTNTLTFSGASTYSGGTTVNAGTLLVSNTTGSGTGTGLVTVNGDTTVLGTLGGTGTITGGVTLATNGATTFAQGPALNPGTIGGVGTLTVNTAGLTTNNLSKLNFDLVTATTVGAGVNDLISTNVIPVIGATTQVNINALSALTPGLYTLANGYTGTLANFGNLSLNTTFTGDATHTGILENNSGALQLFVTGLTPTTAYWAGNIDANWNTQNTSTAATNWRMTASTNVDTFALPGPTTDVHFYTTTPAAANLGAVTLGQDFTIRTLTFDGGALTSAVTFNSGNTLTINNTGGLTVNSGAGAVTLNNAFSLGAAQTWTNNSANLLMIGGNVTNGANLLTVTGPGNTTISGVIGSGSGGLTKNGTGTLTLAGANTYTGATTVSAGTLQMASGGSITTSSANVTIGNNSGDNAALNLTGGSVSDNYGTLGNNAGSSGTATVSSGTWTSGSLIVGSAGTGVFNVTGGSVSSNFGTLGLGSSGTATISSGTWTNGTTLYVGQFGTGVLNVTGGSVSSPFGYLGDSAGSSGTATVSSGTWTIGNILFVGDSGTGVLNVTGTGVVKVGATGTGPLTIASQSAGQGTLNLGTGGVAGTLSAGTISVGSGTAVANFNQTGSYTFAPTLTGSLTVNKLGAGTTVLTAANTYTGATTVTAGTLLVRVSISGSVTTVTNAGSTLGGTGTVGGVSVGGGAILEGGDGSASSGALTSGGNISLNDGSIIELTLGPSGTHSSLVRTGGTWSFDNDQAFAFNIAPGASGSTTYDNIISGLTLAGTEAGLGTIGTWIITTPGVTGTFSFDNNGGVDLTLVTIPEPGAAALLLAGLPLLGLRRRRNV